MNDNTIIVKYVICATDSPAPIASELNENKGIFFDDKIISKRSRFLMDYCRMLDVLKGGKKQDKK